MTPSTGPGRAAAWHVVTGEYPPQTGGVADYTAQLAEALAQAGDEVHVWAPPAAQPPGGRVRVHRLPGRFDPPSLRIMMRELNACPQPRRILVQWVAGAFGWRAMNLPFCTAILLRRKDPVWIMFHEYAYPLGWGLRPAHNLLGLVTPVMSGMLAWRADRILVSTPAWVPRIPAALRRDGRRPVTWLPIPSNIPATHDPLRTKTIRASLAPPGVRWVLGHFGTYGPAMTAILRDAVPRLLQPKDRCLYLIGRGSDAFAASLIGRQPALEGRLAASGGLPAHEMADHLLACDALVQPYEDGVTSRRGTLMAGLSLGLPIVTNDGPAAEAWFAQERAVIMAKDPAPGSLADAVETLLGDQELRARTAECGRRIYASRLSLEHTVSVLRALAEADGPDRTRRKPSGPAAD